MYQVLQRVQTDLAAILADGGASYWYTPAAVHVVKTWDDERLWDPSRQVIYAVRREARHHEEESTGSNATGGYMAAAVDIHILVSQVFTPSAPTDTPDEVLVVERMERDVLRKLLFEDVKLGGLVNNIALAGEGIDDTVIENAPAGWACGEITFRAGYTYPAVAP